jgi:hypothetical protein
MTLTPMLGNRGGVLEVNEVSLDYFRSVTVTACQYGVTLGQGANSYVCAHQSVGYFLSVAGIPAGYSISYTGQGHSFLGRRKQGTIIVSKLDNDSGARRDLVHDTLESAVSREDTGPILQCHCARHLGPWCYHRIALACGFCKILIRLCP